MVSFVIGVNASGKSYFIKHYFQDDDWERLDVFTYQQRVAKESESKWLSAREELLRANDLLRDDIVALVRERKNVVVEHTLYRALRRLGYIDAIREEDPDIPIVVYAMTPSDQRLYCNCEERAKETGGSAKSHYECAKSDLEKVWEFPNPAEGFTKIYTVTDDSVMECADRPNFTLVSQAREELRQEAERQAEKQAKREKHEKLVEATKHIRFWHYCDACGKKELLTADEAYSQGWDYPPGIYKFRLFTPRTCGDCPITGSLYWKIVVEKKSLSELTEAEAASFTRIMNEPESLMPEEEC